LLKVEILKVIYLWSKALELAVPVGDGGEGGTDEEGAGDAHIDHVTQHGHALYSLAQTHLVSQDTVHAVLKQRLHTHNPYYTDFQKKREFFKISK
jgi:hypothetical protein